MYITYNKSTDVFLAMQSYFNFFIPEIRALWPRHCIIHDKIDLSAIFVEEKVLQTKAVKPFVSE